MWAVVGQKVGSFATRRASIAAPSSSSSCGSKNVVAVFVPLLSLGGGRAGEINHNVMEMSLRRTFCSALNNNGDDDNNDDDNNDDDEFATGTVKFYLRNKAYGFIIPDDPNQVGGCPEIFVHRTSFDTPHSVFEFPTRPYLYKGERVKFKVESQDDNDDSSFSSSSSGGTPKALELRFENGKKVSLFRKNYAASAIKGECTRLGGTILEILDDVSLTKEEQFAKIKLAAAASKEIIAVAEQNQSQYGILPPGESDE